MGAVLAQRSQMFKGIFIEDLESDSDQGTAAVSTAALQLILNNATRWNSTYLMIEWLHNMFQLNWQKPVFGILMAFLRDLEVRISIEIVSEEGHLNAEDWLLLVELKHILEPLYHRRT
ncbi:uncharacterized protein CPUR_06801 [Claviceps purpurea 20.1]|uniref:Uncharacterized protein n=1 Tax=Claviceps purpurea (strain 20.1) TaxID=1111077 RepID=M1VZX4_CLAP2|nr:uncharacterized protein CPUR_06801 [Claviceps purpurea 20.1]